MGRRWDGDGDVDEDRTSLSVYKNSHLDNKARSEEICWL